MRRHLALDLTPLRGSRDFRLVFAASGVSGLGSFITYVTVPYQVARLTGSPVAVGLLGLAELVPLLFMAFVGGALADYADRRRLIVIGELAFTALTGALLLNTFAPHPYLWLLYVVAGATAAIDGIQRPALDGLLPRLVPPEQITAAASLQALRMHVASLGGPALAGVLIASTGLRGAYAVDLATFAVSLACLSRMRAAPPPVAAERPSLRSVATGLRYARGRPELLGTYLVDINAMFFGMPQALFPFIADRLGGPAVLGPIYAAASAGALLATLTSGWAARVHRHGVAILVAAGAWGAAIVGFGLARVLWLAIAMLMLAGFADMVSGIFRMTVWNQTIPDHLRGRLAGIEMLSYSTGPTLGNLESGLAARLLGLTGSVVSGGLLCMAGTVLCAVALPAFRRYDGREGLAHKAAEEAAWAEAAAS
ncbi:MAG TPA: MFS transporter [Rugosimonospora sp.]|nr:MFS transporter [Rugosimonospora sp.]